MSLPRKDPLLTSLSSERKDFAAHPTDSQISLVPVGRENLGDALPPHDSYEGRHRYDPEATWTAEEEARVVRKTDLYLLTWICVMVRFHTASFGPF